MRSKDKKFYEKINFKRPTNSLDIKKKKVLILIM